MLQPKKPIKKSNQTTGEFNALMKEYKVNLRKYELDNNPNQLEGETNESYKQRKKYNDFRIKQVEDKNPVKKWYNEMDASQEADPNFLRKTVRKVATSPIHVANYLDDEINLNDTKKYKSDNKKAKEKVKAAGSALDVVGLATMGTLDKGMKAKPVVEQLLTKATTFFGGNKIQDKIEDGLDKGIDYLTNLFTSEKDMKPTKKKKYGYGSSGTISPQLENPMNAIYQSQIDRAYASSQHSDLVNGLNMFGGAAMSIGGQMMSGGKMTGALSKSSQISGEGLAPDVIPASNNFNSGTFMSPQQQSIFEDRTIAAMGNNNASGPIEVEGEEVIETPAGEVAEVKGASHEEGGVDMNVPEGTKIYSKRIEKFGETMAERKKVRERKLTNLNKLLENSKGDIAVKNAHARSVEALNEQEQADLQTQEMFNAMSALQEYAFGTDENGIRKYGNGTNSEGVGPNPAKLNLMKLKKFHDTIGIKPTDKGYGTTFGPKSLKAYNTGKYESPFDEIDDDGNVISTPSFANNYGNPNMFLPKNQFDTPENNNLFDKITSGISDNASLDKGISDQPINFDNSNRKYNTFSSQLTPEKQSVDKPGSVVSRFIDGAGKFVDNSGFKMPGTGDMIGMAGNLYSAFAPMNNTLENRAGDTPNVNFFKDYGKEGLETIDKTKGYVNQVRDEKLQNLELDRTGSIKRNSNSARGVNTMRALNLATDAAVNNQKDATYDTFAQQMMSILGQEAGMKNQRDQVVMGGEQERDLNDRKDRDNFYTQMGKDISTKGEGIQNIGKDLNAIKQNDITTDIINNGISHNGLSYNSKYQLVFNGKTKEQWTPEEQKQVSDITNKTKTQEDTISKLIAAGILDKDGNIIKK